MTSISIISVFNRAFSCWPSRLGGMALLALFASWGADAVAGPPDRAAATVAAAD